MDQETQDADQDASGRQVVPEHDGMGAEGASALIVGVGVVGPDADQDRGEVGTVRHWVSARCDVSSTR